MVQVQQSAFPSRSAGDQLGLLVMNVVDIGDSTYYPVTWAYYNDQTAEVSTEGGCLIREYHGKSPKMPVISV